MTQKLYKEQATAFPGTENLVSVSEFCRIKKLDMAKKRYVYQYILTGLIEPVYIGKDKDVYIDLARYELITLQHLSKKQIRELLHEKIIRDNTKNLSKACQNWIRSALSTHMEGYEIMIPKRLQAFEKELHVAFHSIDETLKNLPLHLKVKT